MTEDEKRFIEAAANGDLKTVQKLYQRAHVDIEAKDEVGSTALIRASENGHKDVVKWLVMYNADIDVRN